MMSSSRESPKPICKFRSSPGRVFLFMYKGGYSLTILSCHLVQGGISIQRNGKIERRSFPRLTLHTILALMPPDDLRADVQSDAKTLKSAGRFFHPVELAEEIGLVILADADAIILYRDKKPVIRPHAGFDFDLLALGRILHGIGQVIDDHLLDPHLISIQLHIGRSPPRYPVVRVGLTDHLDGIRQHSLEAERLLIEFQFSAFDLGQVE